VDDNWLEAASVEDLTNGYIYNHSTEEYTCLFCRETFEEGVIYPIEQTLYEAKKAITQHITDTHHSVFDHLIGLGNRYTGLTEHQMKILSFFEEGMEDKEIVKKLDGGSTSTIRNHRFRLREKEKQAKIFLALMNLLDDKQKEKEETKLIEVHKGATMVDERYVTTEKEEGKILSTYFKEGLNGKLTTLPSKEKRKIIVLKQILKKFESKKVYTEQEVNRILKTVYEDFATLRRYMIEYGFMDRTSDGTKYWVNE